MMSQKYKKKLNNECTLRIKKKEHYKFSKKYQKFQ